MPRKGRSKGLSSVTNSQKKYKASQKVREYGGKDAILTTKAVDAVDGFQSGEVSATFSDCRPKLN